MERFSFKSEVKINKSGRFSPSLVKKIEDRSSLFGVNFSQTLEELADIGVEVTNSEIYNYFRKLSLVNRKTYGQVLFDVLKEYVDNKTVK
ncbi:MAG: hypothetical protein ABIK31_00390 [candidate division WOR-3 bacterium]